MSGFFFFKGKIEISSLEEAPRRTMDAPPHVPKASPEKICFGPFSLYPGRHLLLEDDKPIAVGTRALDILIALAERAGELVTKDELVARAWPNTLVEESNLRAQVALIRKALRDGQAGVRYVAAVPGRGYRFVAPISYFDDSGRQTQVAERRTNLLARLTRPIGRDSAISTICGRFQRHRLTTIVGLGGIGKTTVCLAVAEELSSSYENGVCLLDLAPLSDPQLVPSVLASALNVAIGTENPLPGLIEFLQAKRILLVFDSCERVIAAAANLAEALLRGAPGVHILATSREALRTEGESVYRLSPLEAPPVSAGLTAAEALAFPAVELFVERAAASGGFELTDHDAPVVADICRQLDGIALAIELAAGRVEAFGTRGIAERLDDRFRLLAGGRRTALPRHQTLGATLDWSYEALSNAEQTLLRQLGIFAGEFTLEAVKATSADAADPGDEIFDHLANLIAKSLVAVDAAGPTARYRLLDTTRAYAFAKLSEAGEVDIIARRLAEYLSDILKHSLGEMEKVSGDEWLGRYSRHINNVRVTLEWAFSTQGDPAVGRALTIAAIPLWFQLSSVEECLNGVQRALASIVPGASRDAQARHVMQLYRALGLSRLFTIGLAPQASAAWAKALEIAESLGDVEDQLEALWGLWFCQIGSGEYRAALETGQQFCDLASSKFDRLISDRLISTPLFCMGDHANARRHVDRIFDRKAGSAIDPAGAIRFRFDQAIASHVLLAKLLWVQGFPDQAVRTAQSGVENPRASEHAISLCDALCRGACPIALLVGDLASAERSIAILLDHAAKHGLGPWKVFARCWEGALLIKKSNVELGLSLLGPAFKELEECGAFDLYSNMFLSIFAEGLCGVDRVSESLVAIDRGLARCEQKEVLWYFPELLRVKGVILMKSGSPAAEDHFSKSIEWSRRQAALSWELRSTISLAELRRDQGHRAEAYRSLNAVYGRFTEGFETADLRYAEALLNDLS